VANSFGGVIGGPIVKNRTFYFFDYEGVRRPSQSTLRQVVPPDAFRRGDLSSIGTPLINPFTGQPYPNNQIPINPTAAKALDLLFPRQNQASGASLSAPNYIVNVAVNLDIPSTLNIRSGTFGRTQATQKADLAGPRTIQMSLRVSF